jgi:hypothetical protein
MISLLARCAIVAAAFTVVACVVPPGLPRGAQIKCASDAECPGGTRCQIAIERCVDEKGFDGTAPALKGTPTLSPARGGTSTTFTLAFDVSEPLKSDPVVVVDVGNGQSGTFAIDSAKTNRAKLHYEYHYTPNGTEVAERPSPVTIRLVDVAGNPSGDLAGGVITFDFTGPTFAGAPSVSPSLLGPGTVLTVSFQASEALAPNGAQVDLVDGTDRRPMIDSGDHSTFTYTDDGTEPDGSWDVLVTLTDTSGNASTDLRAGSVTIDNTPPSPISADVRRADGQASRDDNIPDANASTTMIVTFAATEPLAKSPAVRARCGSSTQNLVRTGDQTSAIVFVFELDPPIALTAGNCDVVADLTDLAGNTNQNAVVASPAFTFDNTPPASADVVSAGVIVYRRVPWGADSTGGAKQFELSGLQGAVEPFARVEVYGDPNDAVSNAIAHVDTDNTGAFDLVLPPVDRAQVFVSATDSAGNEGPRALVKNVEWVATLGGKVAGSGFENPHRYESRALLTSHLAQGAGIELSSETALTDGNSAHTSGASTWTNVTTRTDEPDFESPALTFDPVNGNVVAFGGDSCRCDAPDLAPCPETWTRTGELWTEIPSPPDPEGDGNPARRTAASLSFDTARGTAILFGGSGGFQDTWEWNGSSWKNVCTGACLTSSPPARGAHATAYDPVRQKLVLFGGDAGAASFLGDTWEWDGSKWTQVCLDAACVASAPPGRAGHRMTYDPVSHRVLVFGGNTNRSTFGVGFNSEVWEFDGSLWTQLCVDSTCAAGAPPPRSDAAVAFDPRAKNLVVVGGSGADAPPVTCAQNQNTGDFIHLLNDTWTFDGSKWTLQTPSASPTPRHGAMMVDDPHDGHLVLVGGVDHDFCVAIECTRSDANDTWEWDGTNWKGIVEAAETNPTNTTGAASFDGADHEVMLVEDNGEVDAWDGRWRPFGSNAQGAADLAGVTGSAVSSTGNTVMTFGGNNGSVTQENFVRFPGRDAFVAPCSPCATPPPPARRDAAMALDAGGRVLLFGGADNSGNPLQDTWFFTGTWIGPIGGSAPPPRDAASMAFDDDRGFTVLFGGQSNGSPIASNDTWEWDGNSWHQRSPSTSPTGRRSLTLWYDEARHRTILFGGDAGGFFGSNCGNGIVTCGDTWEWDGTDWSQPPIVDVDNDGQPANRKKPAVAFHSARRVGVLFGGVNEAGAAESDTWLYDGGGDRRPAQLMFTVFAAAGTDGSETIADVSARFVAGGTGDNDAAGARLFVWDVDGWHALVDNSAPSSTPADLSWDGDATPLDGGNENVLSRLFFGSERQVIFAVAPATPNGGRAGFGDLSTDAAEVTVRYRLP